MSSDYLRLDLTDEQCALISAHTPYRFHTIQIPSETASSAETTAVGKSSTELLLEPYLPLPFTNTTATPLILTPQRPTDVPRIVEALTDPAVGMQLIGPPWPFKAEDAHSWGEFLRAQAEEVFRDLRRRADAVLADPNAEKGPVAGRWPIPAPRTHSLRRADTGEWAGDFGVNRWKFEDVVDEKERKRLIDENEAKEVFDPTVIWSYGFYLHPDLHGKGLMSLVLQSMLTTYFDDYLGANEVRGAAFASNPASLKTQERCGLMRYSSFMEDVSEGRGGGQKEVITLRRERPQ
ncbi:hypothetical protein JCM10908_004554 [Rhodotorula pacifica]|uniref:GNAT family N-acetyltransferase n=1 Tax=Rhodotorula pacifica TaxID=1495444 RepID=UPI00317C7008